MLGAVYLSGPVTGIDGGNADAFRRAADAIAKRTGRRELVFVPTEAVSPGAPHEVAMRICLRALLGGACADGLPVPFEFVAQLPHWEQSAGARVEYSVARSVGIPCISAARLIRRLERRSVGRPGEVWRHG